MTTISPGIDLEVSARLCASLDGVAAAMDREHAWRQKIALALCPVPFAGSVTLSGGAGTDDQPDKLQAKSGFIWSIRRLTITGFSAGSVTVFRNSASGEQLVPYPAAATNTFGKGEVKLLPNDRLVFSATGITGTVSYYGEADCMESWLWPFYTL